MIGRNKAGDEVAYARFCMGNSNAFLLYGLLDASEFNAGVSGSGGLSTYTIVQMEKALDEFCQLLSRNPSSLTEDWDLRQILAFINNCVMTAHEEGSVDIIFC